MKLNIYTIIAIIALSGIHTRLSLAGGEPVFIKKEQWEKHAKGYDYTEKYKEQKPVENKKVKQTKTLPVPAAAPWVRYLVWALVILALLLVIALLVRSIVQGEKEKVRKKTIASLQDIENIDDAKLDAFLEQSLAEQSFRDAIRVRYLMIIQILSQMAMVTWKKDKTNGSYVNEMYGKSGYELFRQLTINFERVWYGEKEIKEKEYLAMIPLFEELHQTVSPGEQH